MSHIRRLSTGAAWAIVVLIGFVLPPAVAAHEGITVGRYELELGWRVEPAVAGAPNGVQLTITNLDTGEPVTDLAAGDLTVSVAADGSDSTTLSLVPVSSAGASSSLFGAYAADFTPAVAGEYRLRVTGSIHGTTIDATFESSVDGSAAEPQKGPDVVVLIGGAAIVVLLGGMAFLFFGVRRPPSDAPVASSVPSKRKPRRPPGR